MRCPYCAEEVKDDAVVCKHCHRELFVIKPLLDKISVMNTRLAALDQTLAHAEADELTHARRAPTRHHQPALTPLEAFAFTYIALVIAHFLIVVVHPDSKLVYLRVLSIAIPFFFGILCRESEHTNMITELLWGMVVAAAANLTMLAVVAYVDKVSFLPEDAYQWREVGYYSASVAFGFLTGVIMRHILIAIYAPATKPNKIIDWIARFIVEQFTDGKPKLSLRSIRSMVSSVLGFGSAVISIIAGFWEFVH
jgi:hypothetical protein